MVIVAVVCGLDAVCVAAPVTDCNPNQGRVTYDEQAVQEVADADWENQTFAYTQRFDFTETNKKPKAFEKVLHLGTGRYNTQDILLSDDKVTGLAPISSPYIDENTVLLIFLSQKEAGWKCNAVRHRLFVAKIISIQDNSLRIKFGGFTFAVPTADLQKNRLYEVPDVPTNMLGRIFVLTRSTYYHWLKETTDAYSHSFRSANGTRRFEILEAYLAIGTRRLRMLQAHQTKVVVSVNDEDLWSEIKNQSGAKIDCAKSPAEELCVLATAMRMSEAAAKTSAFQITDSAFNDSGPSFGWQQMDIGTNPYARSEAVQLFSTDAWSKERLQTYMHPIRKLSVSNLSGLYSDFVPLADSKLEGRQNQLTVISAYVTEISSELASSCPMAKLPKKMSDDDKRLVRLLQADRTNVGGNPIVVPHDAASVCEVVDATADKRKGGRRHVRWLNIVDAYNRAYGSNVSTCE